MFGSSSTAAAPSRRRGWRWPLLAALLSAALITAALWIILPRLARPSDETRPPPIAEIESRREAGRKLLAEGKFHQARDEFDVALSLWKPHPNILDTGAVRALQQFHRQADLLARLSPLPLEEAVRHARFHQDHREWAARWAGWTVVLDDIVRRDELGRPVLTGLPVRADGDEARVSLEGLHALRDLPLDEPTRLIFGARLTSCQREAGGVWVIRFAPGSGVLLTDAASLEAVCAVPLDDGVKKVLADQQRWVDR